MASNHHAVHFVGSIREAKRSGMHVHAGEREVVRQASGPVYLYGIVDYIERDIGNMRLDLGNPELCPGHPLRVDRLRGPERQ